MSSHTLRWPSICLFTTAGFAATAAAAPQTTTRLSVDSSGAQATGGDTSDSRMSPDGRYVVFDSECTNLVTGDTNSRYHVFLRDRGAETPAIYCTAKTSSLGCVPAIGFTGTPSATNAAPFSVTATQIISNKNGLLFYGYWTNSVPFQGGTLCVRPPTVRTVNQNSAGNAPPDDCSGTFAYDFNARIQSGVDPRLVFGRSVFCQYWYRDPAIPSTTGLSNALRFVIGP